ncbi:MAG: FadR family transcriptional regulator [Deltaproteobacteria bacterium]|nr:MAG: FadR family transcriptional regulator [Deltaproteobacteria bacterium]
MFKPAKRSRVFQDVVEQIQDHILSGDLKEGDFLPSERELQDLFQVSRGTIREALRVLEQKGLIEIKLGVGGGATVRTASVDKVTETLALLIRHQKVSLTHLAEFREGVEGDIAALAAQRADSHDISVLEDLLQKALGYVEKGPKYAKQFLEADRDIHLTLAQIAGNPVYESVERIVQENIIPYYETLLDMEDRRLKENYNDLQEIVAAVKQGLPEKARSLARKHVVRFSVYMKKREGRND